MPISVICLPFILCQKCQNGVQFEISPTLGRIYASCQKRVAQFSVKLVCTLINLNVFNNLNVFVQSPRFLLSESFFSRSNDSISGTLESVRDDHDNNEDTVNINLAYSINFPKFPSILSRLIMNRSSNQLLGSVMLVGVDDNF